MAHQPVVGAVVGHADAAPGALGGLPAVHADQRPAVSPAVQQQNGLLSRLPGIVNGLPEGITDGQIVAQLQLLPHIHNFHIGKGVAVVAFF